MKKNVAMVKLEDKLVRACLSDTNIYDLYKNLAADGGMKMFGVKDAAHLEKIIHKAAADLIEAHWKEIINKHRREDIPSPKNGNDLPNAKPASKKKRNGKGKKKRKSKGNGKKKKQEVIIRNGRQEPFKDAFYYRVPGHYGANQ